MITGIHDFIRQWAKVSPQKVALLHPSAQRVLTYYELDQRVSQCALVLMSHGVKSGDRVAILARNNLEHFEILFACIRLGAAYTPLNWRLAGHELGQIVQRCRPSLLIFDELCSNLAEQILESYKAPSLFIGSDAEAERCAIVSTPTYTSCMSEALSTPRSKMDLIQSSQEQDPEQTAMILYTSGTTGLPKGVMLPHRQLFWNAINTVFACDLSSEDVALAFLPLFHTGGLNCLATPTLYRGGTVVLMDAFDPIEALDLMSKYEVSAVVAVPAMYQMLLEAGLDDYSLPRLKTLLCGGAPLSDTLLDAWLDRGFTFRQGFGMTEIGPNCFSLPGFKVAEKRGSIGQPVLHCDAQIVDDEGLPLGEGEVGELWLRGPIISNGYFEDSASTSGSYYEGWLKTGDLARFDEDGFFYISGRKKEMFISGGENVYPAEVENALTAHPQLGEVAVIGVPDEKWGEVGLAVISLKPDSSLDLEELRAWCRARLAGFKTPKHFRVVDHLPRNASGKVIKAQLREYL